ncbi:hypothetical protein E1B28_007902 [Marasmius oreades]|uniref:Uncharacterized protein n=1 Tax=Marasmius oreades TaxID=181124 RepID=A0A9P7S2L0_9AGAR|nr:uncharacterized protein E1B28_007902 [Marasmius oreades]KAG7094301.1 hypothetical protein E1B28_007902 [Marasmius oreades]
MLRVKGEFDAHWETIKGHVHSGCRVQEMNAFTARKWAKESEEFKNELREFLERKYAEELEAWKKREEWTLDASGYKMAWKKANKILPMISHSISKMFGAGCTILIYGPCGDGTTTVSSVFSIIPDATTSKDVKEFDEAAYNVTHSLCLKYANSAFSSEYIKTRIVNDLEVDGNVESEVEKTADSTIQGNGPDLPSALGAKSSTESSAEPPTVAAAAILPSTPPPSNTPLSSGVNPHLDTTVTTAPLLSSSLNNPNPLPASLSASQTIGGLADHALTASARPSSLPPSPLNNPNPLPASLSALQTIGGLTKHALTASAHRSSLPDGSLLVPNRPVASTFNLLTQESFMNPYSDPLSNASQMNLNPHYNDPEKMMMGLDMNSSSWENDWPSFGHQDNMSSDNAPVFDTNGSLVSSNNPAVNSDLFDLDPTGSHMLSGNSDANLVPMPGQHAYPTATQWPALAEIPQQIQPDISKPVGEGKENTLKRKRDDHKKMVRTGEEIDGVNEAGDQGREEVSTGRKKRNVKAPECEPKMITGEDTQTRAKKKAATKGKKSTANRKANAGGRANASAVNSTQPSSST